MFKKLEHIGIAVESLQDSIKIFENLTGTEHYKIEKVDSEGVVTAFLKVGETKIELLEATTETSAIRKYINKKGEGIHHLAFEVEDILKEMERLSKEGFELIYTNPKDGADNKLVNFIHPKATKGVLIEICQEKVG